SAIIISFVRSITIDTVAVAVDAAVSVTGAVDNEVDDDEDDRDLDRFGAFDLDDNDLRRFNDLTGFNSSSPSPSSSQVVILTAAEAEADAVELFISSQSVISKSSERSMLSLSNRTLPPPLLTSLVISS